MSFINKKHVGFVCVHFTDTNEYIRWGIHKSWKSAGQPTFNKVMQAVRVERDPTDPRPDPEVAEQWLADLVVAAAKDALHDVIPCRSYALMLACGLKCVMIEATRAEGCALKIAAMDAPSPKAADRLIDELEAAAGGGYMRFKKVTGDSSAQLMMPFDPSNPTVSEVDLARMVPPDIAKSIAAHISTPDIQAQIRAIIANDDR